jgi:lysine-specific demethylase 8
VDEFRRTFVGSCRPVVLTGAIEDWPARGLWSPEYFAERFADARVRAYVMPEGEMQLDPLKGFLLHETRVADYVEHVRDAGPVAYYLRANLASTLPQLLGDVRVPAYCRGWRLKSNLWFAKAGTVSGLHFDLPHNLFAQVHGQKRFTLFAPSESRWLYRHPWTSSVPHVARVDPERRDDPRFPEFSRARGFVADLEPGDALFIPERWWHHARTVETSISVNFWWCSLPTLPFALASDAYKKVRGLNI